MKPTSEHIKQMLIADAAVDTDTYKVYIGQEPLITEKFQSITLIDSAAEPPQLNLDVEERYEFPAVQIIIRSYDYVAGWELSESIKKSLHGRANEQWEDMFYTLIESSSDIAYLNWDENQRVRFSVNFNVQRYECI